MGDKQQIDELEAKGRDIFRKYCDEQKWCKVKKESTDQYSSWDVAFTSGNTQMIGEIKYREYDSNAFNDWFLEVKKLKGLQMIQQKVSQSTKIVYINIFKDEIIAIWDLNNLDEQSRINLALAATTFNSGPTVNKDVIALKYYDAIHKDTTNPELFQDNRDDDEDLLPF